MVTATAALQRAAPTDRRLAHGGTDIRESLPGEEVEAQTGSQRRRSGSRNRLRDRGNGAAGDSQSAPILWFDGLAIDSRNTALCHVLQRLGCESYWASSRLDPVLAGPWFVYGPPRSGKSHLASALVRVWCRQRPEQPAVCTTATEFASTFADALDNRRLSAWVRRCARLGLLVIDDLHVLPERSDVQRELVRLLDQFSAREALLVVTSRLELSELTHQPPELISRLQAGLLLELTVPGPEARRALVERLAAAAKILLDPRAIKAIARHPWPNVPELAEAVEALAQLPLQAANGKSVRSAADLSGQPMPSRSLDEREVRRRLGLQRPQAAATLRQIAQRTARYFRLPLAELRGPSRRRAVTTARGVAAYLARRLTGCSLEAIGQFLGGRDHTTILHACQQTEQLARRDLAVQEAIKDLSRLLTRW